MQPPFSDVALKAYVRKSDSLTGLILCAALSVGMLWLALSPHDPPHPLFIPVVLLLFAAICGAGAVRFGGRYFNPPLMLEATQAGVVTYQSLRVGEKDMERVGRLVAWNDVERVDAKSIRVPSGDGDTTVHCVVLRLHPSHKVAVREVSLGNPDTFAVKLGKMSEDHNANALYLDGKTDFGPYTALAAELEQRRRAAAKREADAALGQNRDS